MAAEGLILDRVSAKAFYEVLAPYEERWLNAPLKGILKGLAGIGGKRLLEVGCGNGRRALLCASMGYNVTAVDLSEEMIRLASTCVGRHVDLIKMDSEEMDFDDDEFHISTLILTLEFLKNPQNVLVECMRITKEAIIIASINPFSVLGIKVLFGRFFYFREIRKMQVLSSTHVEDLINRCFGRNLSNLQVHKGLTTNIHYRIVSLRHDKIALLEPLEEVRIRKKLSDVPAITRHLYGGRDEGSIFV